MKRLLIVATLILWGAAVSYGAEDAMEKIDTNKDGRIDHQEFTDAVSETFRMYDKNGDGYLDREEFAASKIPDSNKRFTEIDANQDGKIDHKEFSGAATKWFSVSDMNRDGCLNRSEFTAFRDTSSAGLFIKFRF